MGRCIRTSVANISTAAPTSSKNEAWSNVWLALATRWSSSRSPPKPCLRRGRELVAWSVRRLGHKRSTGPRRGPAFRLWQWPHRRREQLLERQPLTRQESAVISTLVGPSHRTEQDARQDRRLPHFGLFAPCCLRRVPTKYVMRFHAEQNHQAKATSYCFRVIPWGD
jgi:hypothetical protein